MNGTLKGMFMNQDTIDAVQKVVDSGDLDALRMPGVFPALALNEPQTSRN